MLVWRICKLIYAASAFSGEGARLFSGRWNAQGVRMVYTSPSLALAAMEFLVHLDASTAPNDLVSVSASIPDDLWIEEVRAMDLPAEWRQPECFALREIGERWTTLRESVGLRVPSAAVQGEWNVLLNPEHPDFHRIQVGAPEAWSFDPRVLRKTTVVP